MASGNQLSLFATVETTYKIGDRVKLKRKTPAAACLKKGDIIQIAAIHPMSGSCKFWNELTASWGYVEPDEFILLPPEPEIDSPTPAEVAVGESNPPEIDSPTPAEVVVGESNPPEIDFANAISTYRPRGTARGGEYYRFSYREGNKVRTIHIRGGNTDSPIAQAKVQEVRSLLAAGVAIGQVVAILKSKI